MRGGTYVDINRHPIVHIRYNIIVNLAVECERCFQEQPSTRIKKHSNDVEEEEVRK